MTKQDLKELAFNDLRTSIAYTEMDDMNLDDLSATDKKAYTRYYESFKKKVLKLMDEMPI